MATGGTFFVNTGNTTSGDGTTNETDSSADSAYISLSAAEAGLQGVLSSQLIIYCSGGADTTTVDVIGWTTSASADLVIEGLPAGHAETTNNGKNDTNKFSTSYYYQDNTSAAVRQMLIREEYVTIDGIQLRQNHSSSNKRLIETLGIGTSNKIVIQNCKFERAVANILQIAIFITDVDVVVDILANVFNWSRAGSQFSDRPIEINSAVTTVNIKNNTLGRDSTATHNEGFGIVLGSGCTSGTINIINNAIFNWLDDILDNSTGTTVTVQYNASDDDLDTEFSESTNVDISPGGTESDDWESAFTDWNGGDFSIEDTDSVLYNAGTTGGPANDNNGVAYSTNDIGCFAFVAAGGLPPQMLMRNNLGFGGIGDGMIA